MLKDIARNLQKDFRIEFRNRFALNISIAFAGVSTIAISLVAGGVSFSPKVQSIMLWIIIFFSAMSGLSHIFIREEDQGTALFLRMNSSAEAVFLSKLIFNLVFFMAILIVITPLYVFFLQVDMKDILFFILSIASGGISIAATTTILAAMVAKAGGKASLFTIISFPILLPILWISIATTSSSLETIRPVSYGNLLFLLAFSGMITTLSFLLFRFVWIEE